MRIEDGNEYYTICRRDLTTGEVEYLKGLSCYGPDSDGVLRVGSPKWGEFVDKYANHYKLPYCNRRLEGILKYAKEDGYYYFVAKVQNIYEITPVD